MAQLADLKRHTSHVATHGHSPFCVLCGADVHVLSPRIAPASACKIPTSTFSRFTADWTERIDLRRVSHQTRILLRARGLTLASSPRRLGSGPPLLPFFDLLVLVQRRDRQKDTKTPQFAADVSKGNVLGSPTHYRHPMLTSASSSSGSTFGIIFESVQRRPAFLLPVPCVVLRAVWCVGMPNRTCSR